MDTSVTTPACRARVERHRDGDGAFLLKRPAMTPSACSRLRYNRLMSNSSQPRKRNRKPGSKARRYQAHGGNPKQRGNNAQRGHNTRQK